MAIWYSSLKKLLLKYLFIFLRFLQVVLGLGYKSSLVDEIHRRVLFKENLFGSGKELSIWLTLVSSCHFLGINHWLSRMSFAHMTSERFWLSESSLAMITLHWKVNKILLGVDLNLSRLLGGLDRRKIYIERRAGSGDISYIFSRRASSYVIAIFHIVIRILIWREHLAVWHICEHLRLLLWSASLLWGVINLSHWTVLRNVVH